MIAPHGPMDAKIMIVLSAPTPQCVAQKRLLAGYLGQHLRDLAMRAGLMLDSCRVASILAHPNTASLIGDLPTQAFVDGINRVKQEIDRVKPRMVVCVGPEAMYGLAHVGRLTKKGIVGVGDWRGSVVVCTTQAGTEYNAITMQELEPLWQDRALTPFAVGDLARAVKYSTRRFEPPAYDIIMDRELDEEFYEELTTRGPLSFDIEFYGQRLICISFCNSSERVYVNRSGPRLLPFVQRVLTSGVPLVAQNGAYDLSVLDWHYGVDGFKHFVFDTMLAAHSAYIELPKDLGTLCSVYTEQPCYWDKTDWKGLESGRWPLEDVMEYCARDSWVTHVVAERQRAEELDDPAVARTFEFEMRLVEPLWRMSKTGVRWDAERVAKIAQDSSKVAKETLALLGLLYPEHADKDGMLKVRSNTEMPKLIYDTMGFKKSAPTKKNKSGTPTDDMTLAKLIAEAREDHIKEQLRLIRRARKALNMMSKFSGSPDDPESGIQIDADGRFRASYNIGGTDTGRLSSNKFMPTGSGSNGQNMPRDKPVRMCYRPDPGWLMAYNDLERAESLVVAIITQDPLMLEHHMPGKNAHRLLGALLYDRDPFELTDEQYYMSKQTRHAGNYLQGWKTFQDNVNKKADQTGIWLSASEAKRLNGLYREIHPYLPQWWNRVSYEIRHTGKLHNLFGRPRSFFNRNENSLPVQVAYIPQSTVGDAMNYGILSLFADEELMQDVQMLLQVHDALVYQVRLPESWGTGPWPEANTDRIELENRMLEDPIIRDRLLRVRNHLLVPIPHPHEPGTTFTINTETNISLDSWGLCRTVSI